MEHLLSHVGGNHHPLGPPGFKTYARLETRLSVRSPLPHTLYAQAQQEMSRRASLHVAVMAVGWLLTQDNKVLFHLFSNRKACSSPEEEVPQGPQGPQEKSQLGARSGAGAS